MLPEGGHLKNIPATKTAVALALTIVLSIAALGGISIAAAAQPFSWTVSTVAAGVDFQQLSALAPDDVYAAGFQLTPAVEGRVYHYDGTSWSVSLGGLARGLYGIYALDSSHVWAVGQAGAIRFFDGSRWTDQSVASVWRINSVFALDADEVWAVDDGGNLLFYNGSSWSSTALAAGVSLKSVFALDPGHVWVVGAGGTILAWNGTAWLNQSVGGVNGLWSVDGLDTNCVWAVGDNGTVRFFDGNSWVNSGVVTTDDFRGVSALDVNHVFASAGRGRMYLWDGTAWQLMEASGAVQLRGVGALDTDHVYAVGQGGEFVHGYSMLEAQNTTFYFAEGTCRPTFDPYICIQNPEEDTDAGVKITYMLGNGTNEPQELTVPRRSRTTVSVKAVLGSGDDAAHDFSARVECTNEIPIIAERPMYFSYRSSLGVIVTGGHDVVGALQPRPTFYFAEGSCRPNFDPYICIQNPGTQDADVTVTYMLGDGTTKESSLVVPAATRRTLTVKEKLGSGNDTAHDFSARVRTTNRTNIVAERPMYFSYVSSLGVEITGGHDVVGAATPARTFYFAEGTCRPSFDPYICIQNPGPVAARVRITYMKGDGTTLPQDVTVPAHARQTVVAKGVLGSGEDASHDFSAKVETTNGTNVIAERPMYFNYRSSQGVLITGGHDVIGALYPAGSFYFAEGTCRPNFDPYLCIQNPGSVDVRVHITYMKGDGSNRDEEVTVPSNSRYTVVVKNALGSGDDAAHDFSVKVNSTSLNYDDIIVERPMYFNYRNALGVHLTDGHDVVGYSP